MIGRPPKPIAERFWAKVDKRGPDDCWEWTASKAFGYGRIVRQDGVTLRAHRVAYEMMVGPIPEGLQIDHLCRNPGCVNPRHMEPVTGRVNVLRGDTVTGRNARRTHCPSGHPYDEANTHYTRRGYRVCRECRRVIQRPGTVRQHPYVPRPKTR